MTTVTIIGTGNMGSAIAGVLEKGGSTVQSLDHDSLAAATIEGEIVVLAVPYPALADIAAKVGDQLAGKTVVDITNPWTSPPSTPGRCRGRFGRRRAAGVPADEQGAEGLQHQLRRHLEQREGRYGDHHRADRR